jgi:hypothetical protein
MAIVTSHYRYKRPPKRTKAMPLEVPAVVTISEKTRCRVPNEAKAPVKSKPASDDRKPAVGLPSGAKPAAIVTARRPGKRYAEVPPEEHQRRGDVADAMMAEFKRVITEKVRK